MWINIIIGKFEKDHITLFTEIFQFNNVAYWMEEEPFFRGLKTRGFYRWIKLAFLTWTATKGNYLDLEKTKKNNIL